MKKIISYIVFLAVLIIGIWAIFKLVGTLDIAIGMIALTFGVLAIIWSFMALNSLSPGSSLRDFTKLFLGCVIFVLLYSIWQTIGDLFNWTGNIVIVQYFFIAVAFLMFVFAAYKILNMGKEFGFSEKASEIKKIIGKK